MLSIIADSLMTATRTNPNDRTTHYYDEGRRYHHEEVKKRQAYKRQFDIVLGRGLW